MAEGLDQAPSGQVDPLLLLKLLGMRAQAAAGAAVGAGKPVVPAGMTQAQQTPVATPGAPAQGGPPTTPTPSNPASRFAANPERPEAPALSANRTPAASEPGNVPPGPMNAPVLSEQQYDERNPIAPNPHPYKIPGIAPRLMAGLSGAFATLGGNRGAGQALVDRFLNQQEALREASENYPKTAEAEQHKGYMDYLAGAKGPVDISHTEAETRAEDALADQRERDKETLQQQYASAIGKGDKAGAASLLSAIKDLTGAETKNPEKEPRAHTPYDDWREENPNAPVKDWLDLINSEKEKLKGTPSGKTGGKGGPKDYAVQKELIEKDKATALRKLESGRTWNPTSKQYEDPLGMLPPLTQQQWDGAKADIQKEYQDRLHQLGAAPASENAPKGGGSAANKFVPPKGAPSAKGVPDGHQLIYKGKPIATAEGGEWQPLTPSK